MLFAIWLSIAAAKDKRPLCSFPTPVTVQELRAVLDSGCRLPPGSTISAPVVEVDPVVPGSEPYPGEPGYGEGEIDVDLEPPPWMSSEQRTQVQKLAAWLALHPEVLKVQIQVFLGTGDPLSPETLEQSEIRAHQAAVYLTTLGVGSDRMETVGKGVSEDHINRIDIIVIKVRK